MRPTDESPMSGPELQEIKDELGLSDRQIGEIIGYCRETICMWRLGKRKIHKCAALLMRIYHNHPSLLPQRYGQPKKQPDV